MIRNDSSGYGKQSKVKEVCSCLRRHGIGMLWALRAKKGGLFRLDEVRNADAVQWLNRGFVGGKVQVETEHLSLRCFPYKSSMHEIDTL